ncbi:hypothetical protein JRC49_09685 [Clostridiales bacterium FE2011]|nr:hypothetical protein JRC49_09685 [Clostridiales bacterium FE2011]
MEKKKIQSIILSAVFLVVFNAVFFLVIENNPPTSVWIAYSFIHLSYILLLIVPLFVVKSSSSSVFGFSLYTIASIYFFVELLFGIVIIIFKPTSYQWSLIIHLVITGIFATLFLSHLIVNEKSAESIKRHEQEVFFVKDCSSRITMLIGKTNDKSTNKAIEKLYDLIHSSPSKSSSSVRTIENNISILIDDLSKSVNNDDSESTLQIIKQIEQAIDERNRRIGISQ